MADDARKTRTEQQEKWFASVIASMAAETGKSLDDWVAIARACPEATHGKRVKWFKAQHGLGQNRASIVLMHAFPEDRGEPDDLRGALWKDAAARSILETVEARVRDFPGLVAAQRKGYTPFSRAYAFAAVKPVKTGVLLGLAVPPAADARLSAATGKEGWSERLTATVVLTSTADVDDGLAALLRQAFEAS